MTNPSQPEKIGAFLKARASELGFDACRLTDPATLADTKSDLRAFLDAGYHGEMAWLAETAARRSDPLALWPDVRTIILLAVNYGPDTDPLETLAKRDLASISVYARNRDYHDLIKGRLKQLAGQLVARAGGDVKVFVDTAPVMEKPLAQAAGLGWQGKHTNLVSRDFGSWIFLGSIFTTLKLPADGAERDHCGTCRACLDICPTNAFPSPYRIDARRCISYLTIEHKAPIPRSLRVAMGNRIYGCDDCLAVCPWNKFAQTTREAKLAARADLIAPKLSDFLEMDDAAFRSHFAGSPIKRIGRDRFLRNVLIAAGNAGNTELIPMVVKLLADPSSLVRGAAVWALSYLADKSELSRLCGQQTAVETDPSVLEEWTAAGLANAPKPD